MPKCRLPLSSLSLSLPPPLSLLPFPSTFFFLPILQGNLGQMQSIPQAQLILNALQAPAVFPDDRDITLMKFNHLQAYCGTGKGLASYMGQVQAVDFTPENPFSRFKVRALFVLCVCVCVYVRVCMCMWYVCAFIGGICLGAYVCSVA